MAAARLLGTAGLLFIGGAVIAGSRWQTVQSPSNWRAQFAQAALQIPFDADRPPELGEGGSPDARRDSIPKMTIASARTHETGNAGGVAARITSSGKYLRLGIAPGLNYLWWDVVGGKTRFLMIPADTSYDAKWLWVELHQHTPPRKAPRLILMPLPDSTPKGLRVRSANAGGSAALPNNALVAVVCRQCDEKDPLHWCRGDSTMTLSRVEYPVQAFQRFFALNKIPWRVRLRGSSR